MRTNYHRDPGLFAGGRSLSIPPKSPENNQIIDQLNCKQKEKYKKKYQWQWPEIK
jgi:hypothetical protein